MRKPPETYTLMENFCLGLRRLELFGKLTPMTSRRHYHHLAADPSSHHSDMAVVEFCSHSFRPGWVTVLMDDIPDDDDVEMDAEMTLTFPTTNDSHLVYDDDGIQIGALAPLIQDWC